MKKLTRVLLIGGLLFVVYLAGQFTIGLSLYSAIKRDDAELLRRLSRLGVDLDYREPESGMSLLMKATRRKSNKCALFLINSNVALDATENYHGYTCINIALIEGNSEVSRALVDKGCALDFFDNHGRHVLSHALSSRDAYVAGETVSYLRSENRLAAVLQDSHISPQEIKFLRSVEGSVGEKDFRG